MKTNGDIVGGAWQSLLVGLVFLSAISAGSGAVQGQTPDSAFYYGDAVSESGDGLPSGTVIRAVVTGDGSNRTVDEITVEATGEYGGPGFGDDVLEVPGSVDAEVSFVAGTGYGNFTARQTVQNPPSGQQQLDLTYPVGSAEPRPYFEVSTLQPTDETVVEGDTVDVDATVGNGGSAQGTQTVALTVEGQVAGSKEVALGPGRQETVAFSLDTASLGAGDYTYTVASADTSQSGALTVEPSQATFTVSELDPTDLTVVEGEAVNASATLRNEGNAERTQTVRLEAGVTTLASEDVTLAAGAERSVAFTGIGTDSLAPGTYTHGVFSANDSATGTLNVEASRTEFTVSGLDPAGRTLTVGAGFGVSAAVTNDGTVEGTQSVRFRVDGQEYGSERLTLGVGGQQTVSFPPVNTSQLGPGTYTYEVASENDTRTGTLVVESDSPATFTVTDLAPAAPTVTAEETFDASATVTNDGYREATQRLRLQVDGGTVERRAVTLGGGEATTVSFTAVGTDTLGPGTYSYGVFSSDDSRTGTLTVQDDGNDEEATTRFTIDMLDPPTATVARGTAVNVTASVSNDGDAGGTQTVRLQADGERAASRSVTLAAGGERAITLSLDTAALASGSYVYTVATDDDRRAGSLTVTVATESAPTPQPPGRTATTQPPDRTATPADGTPTPAIAEPVSPSATPTQDGGDGSDDGSGGGFLPGGLFGTLITYVGIPLAVIYGVLKALAIYLGY